MKNNIMQSSCGINNAPEGFWDVYDSANFTEVHYYGSCQCGQGACEQVEAKYEPLLVQEKEESK